MKKLLSLLLISVVLILVSSGCDVGTEKEVNLEKGKKVLSRYVDKVDVIQLPLVEAEDFSVDMMVMPNIDSSYPIIVSNHNSGITLELFSSPEKAGSGYESWLTDLVKSFNSSRTSGGISLRSVSSGVAYDYIISDTHIPKLFSPSNDMWNRMLEDSGVTISYIDENLASNTAGIVINKDRMEQLSVFTVEQCIDKVLSGELRFGYTNPLSSSAGLNLLEYLLYLFDKVDPFSDVSTDKFIQFQDNISYTAVNTMQLRSSAQSGKLDAFVFERQTYLNTPELVKDYEFIPFGEEHNQSLVAIGELTDTEADLAREFSEYCKTMIAVNSANIAGFNYDVDYVYTGDKMTGAQLKYAQTFWQEKKSGSKSMNVVFVVDTSGSMEGYPLMKMQLALLQASKVIGEETSVGLVTYSGDVYEALPLDKFDEQHYKYFVGAVQRMEAVGATHSYSALIKALDMLQKYREVSTNTKSVVVLMTDGEVNGGIKLSPAILDMIYHIQIPVHLVSFNYSADTELESLVKVCEAAIINANDDDVSYRLVSLFKSNF